MDFLSTAVLFMVGVAGGLLSALIGGASIITFPVLLATGLSPINAAAVNMVALTPGNILAWIYDRKQLPPFDASFCWMVAVSLGGALLGALLLFATPERTFTLLVPLLLGFSTVLFACAGPLGRWIERRAAANGKPGASRWGATIAALLPVSIYGGYFGAGVGVLLIAVLSIGAGGDYRTTNVIKNFVTSLNSTVACIVFIAGGLVVWTPVFAMMVGALFGAYAGARIAMVVPREPMRKAVIVISAMLTVAYAWRYWF